MHTTTRGQLWRKTDCFIVRSGKNGYFTRKGVLCCNICEQNKRGKRLTLGNQLLSQGGTCIWSASLSLRLFCTCTRCSALSHSIIRLANCRCLPTTNISHLKLGINTQPTSICFFVGPCHGKGYIIQYAIAFANSISLLMTQKLGLV